MKYKFSLPANIKGFVEWQLQHYPEERRQLEKVKTEMIPSCVPNYGGTGGGTDVSRTTENVAMRITTNQYIHQLEWSCAAIERVLSRLTAEDKELIEAVYWKQAYTVEGAALKMSMSTATAYRHINDVLVMVACELGYINA